MCPTRTGTEPHVMASLRNLAITILRLAGHAIIARALRHVARLLSRAFDLLTSGGNGELSDNAMALARARCVACLSRRSTTRD